MTFSAFAVKVTSLYTSTIPVTSQSAEERAKFLTPGFSQVLIKVTGNKQIVTDPRIKTHINNGEKMMQEFSYVPNPSQTPGKPYLLKMNFDSEGINSLLRNAGVPIWGQSRPLILVWLNYEIPNKPAEIVGEDSTTGIPSQLKLVASQRGLPIVMPVIDMAAMNEISPADITNMNLPTITTASKPYAADALLISHLTKTANGFSTQWKFIVGTDEKSGTASGKTVDEVLSAMFDTVADSLAGQYASVMTNNVQAKLKLKVIGVTESDDFMLLMDYLKHLTTVLDVQPENVDGTDVTLNISLHGTQASFIQALSLGQKLTAVPSQTKTEVDAEPTDNTTTLVYQWNH